MLKARLAVVCAVSTCAIVAALAGSASNASADTFVCPDGYQPVPLMALPPDQQDKDKNGNLMACAKGPQGSNEHFNAKDDKQPQYVDDIV
jgi:hypothetical protein